jgi:hypothetical protein
MSFLPRPLTSIFVPVSRVDMKALIGGQLPLCSGGVAGEWHLLRLARESLLFFRFRRFLRRKRLQPVV